MCFNMPTVTEYCHLLVLYFKPSEVRVTKELSAVLFSPISCPSSELTRDAFSMLYSIILGRTCQAQVLPNKNKTKRSTRRYPLFMNPQVLELFFFSEACPSTYGP